MFTPTEMCDVWLALSFQLESAKKKLEARSTDLHAQSNVNTFTPLVARAHELMVEGRNKEWVEWSYDNKLNIRKLPYRVSFGPGDLKFAKERS